MLERLGEPGVPPSDEAWTAAPSRPGAKSTETTTSMACGPRCIVRRLRSARTPPSSCTPARMDRTTSGGAPSPSSSESFSNARNTATPMRIAPMSIEAPASHRTLPVRCAIAMPPAAPASTASLVYGPLYSLDDMHRRIAHSLPWRLGSVRRTKVTPIAQSEVAIPDDALL